MKKIITLMLFINVSLFGFSLECIHLFRKDKLDPNVRSLLGWERVCAHNKLYLYIDSNITIKEQDYICNVCFKQVDNRIGSTLGGNK